jgi:hypothetical protein
LRPWSLGLGALLVAAIIGGCGGSSGGKGQLVRGDGFQFTAPAGWSLKHTGSTWVASSGQVDLVETASFRTVKQYEPAIFAKLPTELGRVAASLAKDSDGSVVGRRRVVVAGRQSWSYRLKDASSLTDVTFVFVDRQEYQLLCRRAPADPTAPCEQLLSTFSLS